MTDGKHGPPCLSCGHPQRVEVTTCKDWTCPSCGKTAGERDHRPENGLLKTVGRGNAWPLCPCGGCCKPINCWRSESYWLCEKCGHKHYTQPPVIKQNDLRWCERELLGTLRRLGVDGTRPSPGSRLDEPMCPICYGPMVDGQCWKGCTKAKEVTP